jgi:hypothetical protein
LNVIIHCNAWYYGCEVTKCNARTSVTARSLLGSRLGEKLGQLIDAGLATPAALDLAGRLVGTTAAHHSTVTLALQH